LALLLSLLPGCGQKKSKLGSFIVEVDKGKEVPELKLTSREKGSLQEVDVNITVTFEDGKEESYPRKWSFWDEPKRIPLPKGAKVEKVILKGGCFQVIKGQVQPCDIEYMERFHN